MDELFIFGTTSSYDFPTTTNSYDTSFNGGTLDISNGLGVNYINGSDIFVSKISADGSSLITFIGGSGNDGLNRTSASASNDTLRYNYADEIREKLKLIKIIISMWELVLNLLIFQLLIMPIKPTLEEVILMDVYLS